MKAFFLLLLFSCSSQPPKTSYKAQTCFSGEGLGFLSFLGRKFNFSFTSEYEGLVFQLGLDFPLIGEEVLSLSFQDKTYKRYKFSFEGQKRMGLKEVEKRAFKLLMSGVSSFLRLHASQQSTCLLTDRSCHKIGDSWEYIPLENGGTFIRRSKKTQFQVKVASPKGEYFSRLEVKLSKIGSPAHEEPLAELKLNYNNCSLPGYKNN